MTEERLLELQSLLIKIRAFKRTQQKFVNTNSDVKIESYFFPKESAEAIAKAIEKKIVELEIEFKLSCG